MFSVFSNFAIMAAQQHLVASPLNPFRAWNSITPSYRVTNYVGSTNGQVVMYCNSGNVVVGVGPGNGTYTFTDYSTSFTTFNNTIIGGNVAHDGSVIVITGNSTSNGIPNFALGYNNSGSFTWNTGFITIATITPDSKTNITNSGGLGMGFTPYVAISSALSGSGGNAICAGVTYYSSAKNGNSNISWSSSKGGGVAGIGVGGAFYFGYAPTSSSSGVSTITWHLYISSYQWSPYPIGNGATRVAAGFGGILNTAVSISMSSDGKKVAFSDRNVINVTTLDPFSTWTTVNPVIYTTTVNYGSPNWASLSDNGNYMIGVTGYNTAIASNVSQIVVTKYNFSVSGLSGDFVEVAGGYTANRVGPSNTHSNTSQYNNITSAKISNKGDIISLLLNSSTSSSSNISINNNYPTVYLGFINFNSQPLTGYNATYNSVDPNYSTNVQTYTWFCETNNNISYSTGLSSEKLPNYYFNPAFISSTEANAIPSNNLIMSYDGTKIGVGGYNVAAATSYLYIAY